MEKIYTKDGTIYLLSDRYSAREFENNLIIEGVRFSKKNKLSKINIYVDYEEARAMGFGIPVHAFKNDDHKKMLLMGLQAIAKEAPRYRNKGRYSGMSKNIS